MPPNSSARYSTTVHLAAGTTIDFAIGRGADGSQANTGLKIQTTITRADIPPPPPPPPGGVFDLSRDFSATANPAGAWSYGWLGTLNGSFGLTTYPKSFSADNGVPISGWFLTANDLPEIGRASCSDRAHCAGGARLAPTHDV